MCAECQEIYKKIYISPKGRQMDYVLYCIVLYCIVLYCTVLYCTLMVKVEKQDDQTRKRKDQRELSCHDQKEEAL